MSENCVSRWLLTSSGQLLAWGLWHGVLYECMESSTFMRFHGLCWSLLLQVGVQDNEADWWWDTSQCTTIGPLHHMRLAHLTLDSPGITASLRFAQSHAGKAHWAQWILQQGKYMLGCFQDSVLGWNPTSIGQEVMFGEADVQRHNRKQNELVSKTG